MQGRFPFLVSRGATLLPEYFDGSGDHQSTRLL
jgi:hypothetical protein